MFTFTWNAAGRLVGVGNVTTTVVYTYNGDGIRVAQAVSGTVTTYVQDLAGGLPQVLVESTGAVTTEYVYGHDLLAEDGTTWAWHLNDGLGSVRQLADGDGDVTLAQGYTPFGVLLWREGDAASGYGFTGEQEDVAVGLVFLRARYHDPATGRFISKDPFPGMIVNPASLHPYIYTYNNPVNLTDPSGEWIESGLDLLFIGYDLASMLIHAVQVHIDPCNIEARQQLRLDSMALALDALFLLLPGATGGTIIARGGEAVLTRISPRLLAQLSLKSWQAPQNILYAAKEGSSGNGGWVPNPGGSKGKRPHRSTVERETAKLKRKYRGRRVKIVEEYYIPGPGGKRLGSKKVDIAVLDAKGKPIEFVQVGVVNKNGLPVPRERRALDAIERMTGVRPRFVPYKVRSR